jgi:hypothetical protein
MSASSSAALVQRRSKRLFDAATLLPNAKTSRVDGEGSGGASSADASVYGQFMHEWAPRIDAAYQLDEINKSNNSIASLQEDWNRFLQRAGARMTVDDVARIVEHLGQIDNGGADESLGPLRERLYGVALLQPHLRAPVLDLLLFLEDRVSASILLLALLTDALDHYGRPSSRTFDKWMLGVAPAAYDTDSQSLARLEWLLRQTPPELRGRLVVHLIRWMAYRLQQMQPNREAQAQLLRQFAPAVQLLKAQIDPNQWPLLVAEAYVPVRSQFGYIQEHELTNLFGISKRVALQIVYSRSTPIELFLYDDVAEADEECSTMRKRTVQYDDRLALATGLQINALTQRQLDQLVAQQKPLRDALDARYWALEKIVALYTGNSYPQFHQSASESRGHTEFWYGLQKLSQAAQKAQRLRRDREQGTQSITQSISPDPNDKDDDGIDDDDNEQDDQQWWDHRVWLEGEKIDLEWLASIAKRLRLSTGTVLATLQDPNYMPRSNLIRATDNKLDEAASERFIWFVALQSLVLVNRNTLQEPLVLFRAQSSNKTVENVLSGPQLVRYQTDANKQFSVTRIQVVHYGLNQFTVGDIVEFGHLLSTSMNYSYASVGFLKFDSRSTARQCYRCCVYRFLIPLNYPCLAMGPKEEHGEQEVILPALVFKRPRESAALTFESVVMNLFTLTEPAKFVVSKVWFDEREQIALFDLKPINGFY